MCRGVSSWSSASRVHRSSAGCLAPYESISWETGQNNWQRLPRNIIRRTCSPWCSVVQNRCPWSAVVSRGCVPWCPVVVSRGVPWLCPVVSRGCVPWCPVVCPLPSRAWAKVTTACGTRVAGGLATAALAALDPANRWISNGRRFGSGPGYHYQTHGRPCHLILPRTSGWMVQVGEDPVSCTGSAG
eukprot:gene24765-biopygen23918